MKKSIISFVIALVGFGFCATSCEDMLTPDMERYATDFNGKDTVNFYAGILRNLQQVVEQNVLLGELRGDLVKPTDFVTDSIKDIMDFKHKSANAGQSEDGDNMLVNRAAYYKVVNQCNYYLARVDSLAKRNNHYYMYRETAQVLLIRAWTYMQLVQNYGRVPFITQPISNSTTGWESNPEAWATPDNLLDLLKNDMDQAWRYCETEGYPNYGSMNNGAVDIAHRVANFDADVVYGDLYLLRGRDKSDFEKAANYFYNFLYGKNRTGNGVRSIASVSEVKTTPPSYYISCIGNQGWPMATASLSNTYAYGGETVTGIPSAANSNFGLVLSRIPNIYGFDVHSGNSTTAGTDADGNVTGSISGSVWISPNYRVRQVEPSPSYQALNEAQVIIYPNLPEIATEDPTEFVIYPTGKADARMLYSAPIVETDKGKFRFISKFGAAGSVNSATGEAYSFTFKYLVPVYRYRTVMLRYAEALNRAGFPQHAFAVLRDGINSDYPNVEYNPYHDDPERIQADSIVDDVNKTVTYLPYLVTRNQEKGHNGYNYIDFDEMCRAKNVEWIWGTKNKNYSNVGVHQAGCGEMLNDSISFEGQRVPRDTVYQMAVQVEQRLAEEKSVPTRTRVYEDNAKRHNLKFKVEGEEGEEGEEPDPNPHRDYQKIYYQVKQNASKDEMFAVELMLADEYALECAFEGNRYYDLMRIARHLNTFEGEGYGTDWLAWKIGRRQFNGKPYERPEYIIETDIYNYLQNPQNWYLQNPK